MSDIQNVAVTLPNDTVYVEGTVNETAYVFTLSGTTSAGTIWTADVARATPDVYVCRITATSSTGSSTTIETTLYYGLLNLITDRTQADVDRVVNLAAKGIEGMTDDERAEYLEGMKGAYNATDLNRVESAVQYVVQRLSIAGLHPELVTKTIWDRKEFPILTEMERYLGNVRKLRSLLTMPAEVPEVPEDMDRFTYREANDIEKILLLIDAIITDITLGWMYCGEIYAGEV